MSNREAMASPARMGRPQGEARQAIAAALRWFIEQRRAAPLTGLDGTPLVGATWPEIMRRSGTSWELSAETIDNMTRAGELAKLGKTRVQGNARPLTVYGFATGEAANSQSMGAELSALMGLWGKARHEG